MSQSLYCEDNPFKASILQIEQATLFKTIPYWSSQNWFTDIGTATDISGSPV